MNVFNMVLFTDPLSVKQEMNSINQNINQTNCKLEIKRTSRLYHISQVWKARVHLKS